MIFRLQCSLRGFFRSGPTYLNMRTIWFDVGLRDGWRNELRYILVVCVGSIQLSPAQVHYDNIYRQHEAQFPSL